MASIVKPFGASMQVTQRVVLREARHRPRVRVLDVVNFISLRDPLMPTSLPAPGRFPVIVPQIRAVNEQ
jgi:hypothetical protein